MRPDFVVMPLPVSDDDAGFEPVPEPFHRQAFIAEFPVEALSHTVLRGLARFDQYRFQVVLKRPFQELRRQKFRFVIAAQVFWCTSDSDQFSQHVDVPFRPNPRCYVNR